MARSQADLLAMKAELTNDPTGIGLTTLPADDAANADKINLVRATVAIDRDDVPADEVRAAIVRTEYGASVDSDQNYINLVLGSGLIDTRPNTNVRNGLLGIFGAGTTTRTNLQALLTRDGKRWEEMVQDGLLVQAGDWTPSEIAQARQAV